MLVYLPTTTSKLTAKWQGPYCVKAKVTPVTYEIDMCDKKMRKRVFHVNMLKAWNTPTSMCLMAEEVKAEEEIPSCKENGNSDALSWYLVDATGESQVKGEVVSGKPVSATAETLMGVDESVGACRSLHGRYEESSIAVVIQP